MRNLDPTVPPHGQSDDEQDETDADRLLWLEDASSERTREFIKAENRATTAWLSAVPTADEIALRIRELSHYPRLGTPFERGGRWFQYRNAGFQEQSVLFVMDRPTAEGEVLIDPNGMSEQGTIALVDAVPSMDGRLLAYATADTGSDWLTWRVRDISSGTLLPDVVRWSKYSSVAWRVDASGFYYGAPHRPEPGRELEGETRGLNILFHNLGARDGDDEVVFSTDGQPEWLPHASITDDGRYLVVSITRGTRPEVRIEVFDFDQPGEGSVVLDSDFSHELAVAGNDRSRLFMVTGSESDRRRLVAVDLSNPEQIDEIVPETGDLLVDAKLCGDAIVCCYLRDAQAAIRLHDLDGHFIREIDLPPWSSLIDGGQGSISVCAKEGRIHFATTSFTDSGSVWDHDLASGETTLVHTMGAPFVASDYVTERGHAVSADGTLVPFFCTHRRDICIDGEVPVLLNGYGGFNVPISPGWSVLAAGFMERGGAYVLANLRGGGEFGRTWSESGRREHKQRVFDDFLAVARELTQSGLTRPDRTVIHGGSNGGLLVGASITQHPEEFGAAIAEVGVFDMLRFHKFTIGWAWSSDYGDPSDPAEYRWLRAYSPLHNVREGIKYPATLLLTGDHDDRVVPAHSYKFAAALQRAQAGDSPILLRIESFTGHGSGKPMSKRIDECADMLTFIDGTIGVSSNRAVR